MLLIISKVSQGTEVKRNAKNGPEQQSPVGFTERFLGFFKGWTDKKSNHANHPQQVTTTDYDVLDFNKFKEKLPKELQAYDPVILKDAKKICDRLIRICDLVEDVDDTEVFDLFTDILRKEIYSYKKKMMELGVVSIYYFSTLVLDEHWLLDCLLHAGQYRSFSPIGEKTRVLIVKSLTNVINTYYSDNDHYKHLLHDLQSLPDKHVPYFPLLERRARDAIASRRKRPDNDAFQPMVLCLGIIYLNGTVCQKNVSGLLQTFAKLRGLLAKQT